jgi:hypothetical protein
MVSDPQALREKAARYRETAAELRERAERPSSVSRNFLLLAQEYEDMASQLDHLANDFR